MSWFPELRLKRGFCFYAKLRSEFRHNLDIIHTILNSMCLNTPDPDEARMSFNLEAILRRDFFGKAVLIIEDSEDEIPVDSKNLDLISAEQLDKMYGVIWEL